MAKRKYSQIAGVPVVLPTITAPLAYSPVFTITGGSMSGQTHESCWSQNAYYMDLDIAFSGGTTSGTITNFSIQLPLNPLTGTPYTIGGPVGARYMGGGIDGFGLVTNRFDGTIQGVQGDTNVTINLDAGNSFAAAGSGRSLRATIRLPIAEFASTAYRASGAGWSTYLTPGLTQQGPQKALTVTSAQPGFAVQRAVGIAYTDQNGVWRAKGNITAAFTTAAITSIDVSISGTVFKNSSAFYQPCTVYLTGGTANGVAQSITIPNSGTISTTLISSTANKNQIVISFDVELESKPTWAT